jgi:hypothetical protein
MEYPFNPFTLAGELSAYGFSAKLVPPVFQTGHPLKRAVGAVIAALSPPSIIVQPSFYILAAKTAESRI